MYHLAKCKNSLKEKMINQSQEIIFNQIGERYCAIDLNITYSTTKEFSIDWDIIKSFKFFCEECNKPIFNTLVLDGPSKKILHLECQKKIEQKINDILSHKRR